MRILLAVACLIASVSPLQADTWEITVDGLGDAPTIQAGIDSSASGDTVLVHPGTYFEHLDYLVPILKPPVSNGNRETGAVRAAGRGFSGGNSSSGMGVFGVEIVFGEHEGSLGPDSFR